MLLNNGLQYPLDFRPELLIDSRVVQSPSGIEAAQFGGKGSQFMVHGGRRSGFCFELLHGFFDGSDILSNPAGRS